MYRGVQEHYIALAKASKQNNERQIAEHFGYDAKDLSQIPEESNLGVSCGNPLAIATLEGVS